MCGIAGLLGPVGDRSGEALEAAAQAMSDRLSHRGPDGRGIWSDPAQGVALGHRRLAVVDLSDAGAQPMVSHDGRWVMSYNGESYNAEAMVAAMPAGHRSALVGHSDTEVLLETISAIGVVPALERMVGMFALAVWDRQSHELWLARDRFGEKPLYHGRAGRTLVFGSELKALHAVDGFAPDIDRNSVTDLLKWGCIPAPKTIYDGVSKVRPGHVLRFDSSGRRSEDITYWSSLEVASEAVGGVERGEDAVDELEELLQRTVTSRMVSDVPIGAFLSGGIDSSTIVAMMGVASARPVETFTVGFSEPAYDESRYAAAVASYLGTDHHELVVSPSEAREVIPLLPGMYDEPFADSSQIPTFLVSRLARRHVTVSLAGAGGDELFGGYARYRHLDRFHRVMSFWPAPIRRVGGSMLRSVPSSAWDRIGTGTLARLLPGGSRGRLGHLANKAARVLAAADPARTYEAMMTAENSAEEFVIGSEVPAKGLYDLPEGFSGRGGFEAAMLMDTVAYLPDDLLTKTDRASMAVSLEARLPFLDPEVFRFAWSLHQRDRFRDGSGKWAMRRLLERYVPSHLTDRPKMGFGVPVGPWLRGPLRGWADGLLDPGLLAEQGLFDPALVSARWSDHVEGRADHTFLLWSVLMFQAWQHELAIR